MKLKVHWEKEHSHVAQAHVDYDDLLEDYIIKAGLPLPGTSPQVVAAKTEPHGEDEPISPVKRTTTTTTTPAKVKLPLKSLKSPKSYGPLMATKSTFECTLCEERLTLHAGLSPLVHWSNAHSDQAVTAFRVRRTADGSVANLKGIYKHLWTCGATGLRSRHGGQQTESRRQAPDVPPLGEGAPAADEERGRLQDDGAYSAGISLPGRRGDGSFSLHGFLTVIYLRRSLSLR